MPVVRSNQMNFRRVGRFQTPFHKRQILSSISLNESRQIGDPNGIRTRVSAVKGRCPNRWTIGSFLEKRGEYSDAPRFWQGVSRILRSRFHALACRDYPGQS